MKNKEVSILDMAMGAIKERVSYELATVIDNILDLNTPADKARSITLELKLIPDAYRKNVVVDIVVKKKLPPTSAITTTLYISGDDKDATVYEMTPQVSGQMGIDGEVQEEPKILALFKEAK